MTGDERAAEERPAFADVATVFGAEWSDRGREAPWLEGDGLNVSELVSCIADHLEAAFTDGDLGPLVGLGARIEAVLTGGTFDQMCLVDSLLESLAFRLLWREQGLGSPFGVALSAALGPRAWRGLDEHSM